MKESLDMAARNNKNAGNGEVNMTRFSVNQIHENPTFTLGDEGGGNNGGMGSYYGDSNGLENQDSYILSLRHQTKEALPRIDLYRNTKSISYANRPTLDELHNSTLTAVRGNGAGSAATAGLDGLAGESINPDHGGGDGDNHGHVKFGWIQGVLVLNIMSLWGPMLFLRTSWLVGQGGIIEACVVILFSTLITSITALSTSAIATNGEVKGGGTYYMLSRSLGPEYGGAIGLIFAFANMVGVAMNLVGFCESLTDLLDVFGLKIVDGGVNDTRIIGVLAAILCIVICLVGMEWEQKAQMLFLFILLAAITDVIVGSFMPPDITKQSEGVTGWSLDTARQNVFEDYRGETFFSIFSVYFPSATGILSGANISGELKDPQSSIPKGTLLAIFITSTSYILFAIISGFCVIRDASGIVVNGTVVPCGELYNVTCEYGLQNRDQMLEIVSAFRWLIYAGNFAATLSSALACLVGAPRVFQALCRDKIYPYIYWFGKGYGKADDPIRCYALTFVIAVGFILIGDLNSIAPIMSNFFMAAFALINFAVFHASISKSPGFRPAFKYWNKWVSALGAVLCFVIMFVMDYKTAIITVVICIVLYTYLYYNKPNVNWGSSNQAATYINAVKAAQELNLTEEHVKNYRPQILVLSGKPSSRPQLVDFTYYLTKGIGISICGHVIKTPISHRQRSALVKDQYNWFLMRKLKAFYSAIEDSSLENGAKALIQAVGVGKLRPNMIMLGYKSCWQVCDAADVIEYVSILHDAFDRHLAVGILRMPNGLDYSYFTDDMEITQSQSCKTLDASNLNSESEERLKSAASTNSLSSEYMLESSPSVTALDGPDQMNKSDKKNNTKNKKGGINIPDEIWGNIQWFHRKQDKGTIDVWWLYDDGGLTLLIPYILSTRKDWLKCKLRVFSLASRHNPLGEEQRNMAALLSKFRIDCTDVIVLPDTNKPPNAKTIKDFNDIIGKFNESSALPLTEANLEEHKERSNRYMRVRDTLQEYSKNSTLVAMTLPMPRKNRVPTALYMTWLEMMTMEMPPFLLIRGNQTSVLTFYS